MDHVRYKIRDLNDADPAIDDPPRPAFESRATRADARGAEVRSRLDALIADFDQCVEAHDLSVPFTRSDQYEFHRRTIDRRWAVESVEAAIHDEQFTEQFTELLYETLQRWGIGQRASRLVPLTEFPRTLANYAAQLLELEPHTLELLTESVGSVSTAIDFLVSDLAVVENRALIVAGAKTLHHVLPDLVSPMDRAWTGAFFGWTVLDPQNNETLNFGGAFEAFAEIARLTYPSRLVGGARRTSSTKVLDNALIGYCKLQGIQGTST